MKSIIKPSHCFAALAAVAVSLTAVAAEPDYTKPGYTAKADGLSHADASFIEKAAKLGHKEVAVSEGALPRLITPAARDFAQTVIKDHGSIADDLQALATKKGVVLPVKDADIVKEWDKKDKKDALDEAYWAEMVSDHKDAVDLFEKAVKSKDVDVATFAAKTLPTLRHHLEVAKAQKKLAK